MMSKKDNKQSDKTKERGLNVRVTQEQKSANQENVRVNSYFEKNDSRRKKKAKKTSAKTAEKTLEKDTAKINSTIKKETKKPASFSRNGDLSKRKDEPKVEILLPEKPAEKAAEEPTDKFAEKPAEKAAEEPTDKFAEKPAEKPVEKLADKPAEKAADVPAEKPNESEDKITEQFSDDKKAESSQEFETLKLDAKITRAESKVIIRDVEKEKPIERSPEKPAAKLEKTAEKKTTRKEISRPVQKKAPAKAPAKRLSAKEIKQREIEKAVKAATKLPVTEKKRSRNKFSFDNFGWTRAVLAVACATTAIFAAVYFVNLTSTDMSLKVAAMQSGIEASYPSYVPRGYSLSDVTSSSGKVKMNFKSDEGAFSISEENSSWDSNALLNNYIKENYSDDEYTVIREQGLTLYMGDDWEAWVNGGMLYKLAVNSGTLTKKQMKTIATSL